MQNLKLASPRKATQRGKRRSAKEIGRNEPLIFLLPWSARLLRLDEAPHTNVKILKRPRLVESLKGLQTLLEEAGQSKFSKAELLANQSEEWNAIRPLGTLGYKLG
ncbi:hypothetical protein Pcinc_040586 [Petrolisthes cinctipes]|uniref:Uncharacterized protein n=1 Tax=Petrolisthes cinctipes TaxID=88211 RepID=A0AAE1BL58_PETCI|nr:hypothetical protein Pcinc_040586 [Petrolisthes cinctipes]